MAAAHPVDQQLQLVMQLTTLHIHSAAAQFCEGRGHQLFLTACPMLHLPLGPVLHMDSLSQ